MKSKLHHIGYYLLLVFVSILPLNTKSPILITLTLSAFALCGVLQHKPQQIFRNIFTSKFSLSVFVFFIYCCLSLFYSDNLHAGLFFIQIKVTLLLLAFSMPQYNFTKQQIEKLYGVFANSIFCFVLFFLLLSTKQFIVTNDTSVFFVEHLMPPIFRIQPSVFSAYVLASIIILTHRLSQIDTQKKKISCVLQIIILSISLILLGSKATSILFLCFLVYQFIFILLKKNHIRKQFILVFLCCLSGVVAFLFYQSQSLQNRFRDFAHISFPYADPRGEIHYAEQTDTTRWTTVSYRIALMKTGFDVVKNNLLFGVGVGDVREELLSAYEKQQFVLAIKHKSLVHNSYLEILIAIGLVGFILFLFILYRIAQNIIIKQDTKLIALFLLFMCLLLFDNYLDRLQGLVFLSLFWNLMAYTPSEEMQ